MRTGLSRLAGRLGKAGRLERLAEAHRRLFAGRGDADDAAIVLADLADHSGFFKVTRHAAGEVLQFNEGRRAAFSRIFTFLSLTPAEVDALARAAREEFLQKQEDGDYL